MIADKNSCFWEKDKSSFKRELGDIRTAIVLLSDWKTTHTVDANERKEQIGEIKEVLHAQAESMIRMEGSIALIQNTLNGCAERINTQVESNTQKEEELKEAHDKFNSNVLKIILFVIGSIATFLVAWGSMNTTVDAHGVKIERFDKHIEEDEARWIIFPIEHQMEKLHE